MEQRQIKSFLENSTSPLSISELMAGLNILAKEKRSLLRRLEALIADGVVMRTGKGRSIRYLTTRTGCKSHEVQEPKSGYKKQSPDIILTTEALDVKNIVTGSIQSRTPVTYNAEFLMRYEPNISSYLSNKEKSDLAIAGVTAQMNEPGGTYAKKILERLLIDLSWNSSRLEGNSYSLLETKMLIDKGIFPPGKSNKETQMILNHKDVIEFMVENADTIGMNRYSILNIHGMLSYNLLPTRPASGRLRTHAVGIGGSVYTPLGIPQKIEEMFDLMLGKADRIKDPFEQAFFMMVHLPYLQPFEDVNKRVSRMAAGIPFYKKNYAPLSFIEVPNDLYTAGLLGVYELNRVELLKEVFIWAYQRSAKQYEIQRQVLGEPDSFRIQYRADLRQLVSQIMHAGLTRSTAQPVINAYAAKIPLNDRLSFIDAVVDELDSIHEGNFAKYYVTPSQFKIWSEHWES